MLRQYYLMRGSPARVLPLFAWVAVDMVTWGFITKYLNAVSGSGFNFVPSLLGAVLLWDFFVRVMQGVTTTFFEDVWSRNFLNIFATPLSISEYVSGLVLSSIATSSVGLVVMLVLATAVFGLSFFVYGVLLIPYLLVLFLFGIALGVIGCGIVLRLGPASEWFIWPIPALIFAVRRRLLSAFHAARLDAICVAAVAAILCVRKHAQHRPEARQFTFRAVAGRCAGRGVPAVRELVLSVTSTITPSAPA